MTPETPFLSNAQRAWLNGFVTGFLGVEPKIVSDDALALAGLTTETVILPPAPDTEEFPWHQPELPIAERLEMAESRPLKRKLMAAMAQLDCGSCGYVCQTYSEAIAEGAESDLSLCTPGGKETKQTLKKLIKQNGGVHVEKSATRPSNASGYSRKNPFTAKFIESRPLNHPDSEKDTRQVIIDLAGSDLTYKVGDALGVWPTNCDQLVQSILTLLQQDPDQPITTPLGNSRPPFCAFREDCCLKDPSDELLELLLERSADEGAKKQLSSLLQNGVDEGFDVLDALELAFDVRLSAQEFCETLESIKPRLYSIASSMKAVGDQVHLTVGKVSYERNDRLRRGVASTLFAERLQPGDDVRVYIHPNQMGFTTPIDGSQPIIMIGPGTGIAPFIGFLQEREATKATGQNWLFFGDQRQTHDFLYEPQLKQWFKKGLLNRISVAFSRDTDEKVYVQTRLRQQAAEVWNWIDNGAAVYICGDASRMAADVNEALVDICQRQGNKTRQDAGAFLDRLSETGRYLRDVY